MKIFLSHSSQDKATAESIAFSLRSRGYKVFLDRDDLPAGATYDQQIGRAVKDSEIFIFLISPDSVAEGRYTMTELTFARHKWRNPNGRVLPVMARKTPLEQVPSYLKAVTILEPLGNITAETSKAVDDMRPSSKLRIALLFVAAIAVLSAVTIWWFYGDHDKDQQLEHPPGTSVWTVDKSYVYLDTTGGKRQFILIRPSSDLRAQGARPGSQLFIGEKRDESYVGKLFVFAGRRCQPREYDATGPISNNTTVTLAGMAPQIDPESCSVTGVQERTLVFNYKYR